jgi:hypothetical protein
MVGHAELGHLCHFQGICRPCSEIREAMLGLSRKLAFKNISQLGRSSLINNDIYLVRHHLSDIIVS